MGGASNKINMFKNNDERQIRVIIDYINNLPIPESRWPEREFLKASYALWAANEILVVALSDVDNTPLHAIEEFKCMVGKFAQKVTPYDDRGFIFDVAYDVATDISDILYGMIYP